MNVEFTGCTCAIRHTILRNNTSSHAINSKFTTSIWHIEIKNKKLKNKNK